MIIIGILDIKYSIAQSELLCKKKTLLFDATATGQCHEMELMGGAFTIINNWSRVIIVWDIYGGWAGSSDLPFAETLLPKKGNAMKELYLDGFGLNYKLGEEIGGPGRLRNGPI